MLLKASEIGRITMADGTIGHCELAIGNSKLMLAEENKQWVISARQH